MKKNRLHNNIDTIFFSLILIISMIAIDRYISFKNPIESKEIGVVFDTKLGQLSDVSKKIVAGINPLVKSNQTSVFVGKKGGENCSLTLNFRLEKEFNYTIIVKNEGNRVCENVSTTVYYSNNESFASSSPKASASNYYWQFGSLSPNDTKTISFITRYREGGDISYSETESCITADNGEDVCATLNPVINPVSITSATNNTAKTTSANKTDASTNTSFDPKGMEYGTWVWTSPYAMSATYKNQVIHGAISNKINVIYISIDDYLQIDILPSGVDKNLKKNKYSDALENFIVLANKNNIQVDVVAGWRDWAEEPNTNKPTAIIDYAVEYNSSRKSKIRGVQFDVEPYLLADYEKNKSILLLNFVKFVKKSSNRLGSNPLRLSIVIPHFYDGLQKWTPIIEDDFIYNYPFNHILRILDKRPGSSIILMSYRNSAEGDDGSIKISKVEIDQTSSGPHSTKVIIGQEVGNVEPDYVTFYQTSKSYYVSQLNIISQHFKDKKGFGGTAVHYIDPLLNL